MSGFPVARIRLGEDTWTVAVAADDAARGRGLMGVEDLGDLDGMIFVWEDAAPRSFFMLDTLIPLEVAFFDAAGVLTEVVAMTPCPGDPCPTYPSSGPVRWAIEAVPGSFVDHPPGTRLDPP